MTDTLQRRQPDQREMVPYDFFPQERMSAEEALAYVDNIDILIEDFSDSEESQRRVLNLIARIYKDAFHEVVFEKASFFHGEQIGSAYGAFAQTYADKLYEVVAQTITEPITLRAYFADYLREVSEDYTALPQMMSEIEERLALEKRLVQESQDAYSWARYEELRALEATSEQTDQTLPIPADSEPALPEVPLTIEVLPEKLVERIQAVAKRVRFVQNPAKSIFDSGLVFIGAKRDEAGDNGLDIGISTLKNFIAAKTGEVPVVHSSPATEKVVVRIRSTPPNMVPIQAEVQVELPSAAPVLSTETKPGNLDRAPTPLRSKPVFNPNVTIW